MSRILLILIVFLFKTLTVSGQGFSFSRYYDTDDYNGFVTNWSAEQDSNGYLYFAIGDGVVIFDGVKWQHRHLGEFGRATNLFMTSSNEMFASGQFDFGLLAPDSINNIEFFSLADSVTNNDGLINVHFASLETDSSTLFYGRYGVDVIKDQVFERIEDNDLQHNELFMLGDNVYAVSSTGIFLIVGNQFQKLGLGNSLFPQMVTFVIPKNDKKALLGFTKSDLQWFDGENLNPLEIQNKVEVRNEFVYDGLQINDSLFAIATAFDGGAYIYDWNGRLKKVFNQNSGLEATAVYDLFLDKEMNLWIGTDRYIQKLLVNNPVNKYGKAAGIEHYVIKLFKQGDKLYFSDSSNEIYSSYLSGEKVLQFKKNEYGVQLFQWGDSVLFQKNEKLFFSSGQEIYNGGISFIIRDYDDSENLVFVNNEGVFEIKAGKISQREIPNLSSFSYGVKTKGQIYLLDSMQGLFVMDGTKLKPIPFVNPKNEKVRFNDLKVLNDRVFISIEGSIGKNGISGIYQIDSGTKTLKKSSFFEELDPDLVQNQVMVMEQCKNGDIWVKNGFFLKRIVEENGRWQVIKSPYNLIGDNNSIYSILCDGDQVWFGGINGIYQLTDPDWKYEGDFNTNITGVYVHNDSLIYGGYGEPLKPTVLPYEDNELRFTFAAASYIDETRNTYSVKLEGFDDSWSDWSLETQKDYTNIPEGNYAFKVRSKNVYEVDGKEDSFSFSVLPPWYRTWWAYVLYAIAVFGVFYTGFKIRINQLLKVERMRTKIASDLHDEVSATLTGISFFAEAVGRDEDITRKEHFVGLIKESAGEAKEKITDIVWSINPENDNWEMFLAKCRRYASDLLESSGLDYTLNIAEQIPGKITMEVRQHVWMIYKEMLTNVVRHSGADRVDVIFDYKDQKLVLVIQDNGKGLDAKRLSEGGNGLQNIQRRAKALKAEIDMNSESGFGTRWFLKIPY